MSPLLAQVEAFLNRKAIAHQPIVVAVSGGPDSLALLCAFQLLAKPAMPVIAAHLNHQLRGPESDADASFVMDFCRQNQIQAEVESIDVRREAEVRGENLESTARRLRYDWLAAIARKYCAPWVATGHTADDQAETVLHNLIRGTGLRGLRGIAPRRGLADGVEIIRPLLAVSRAEVLSFLEAEQLTARQDSSNLDLNLTRNRIRQQLLPLLREGFNPQIVTVLGRLAAQAANFTQIQEEQGRATLAAAEKPKAGEVIVLDVDVLRGKPRHLVREVFHLIWEREQWPLDRMGYDDWDRLAGLIDKGASALELPGGMRARRKGAVIQLWRKK